MRRAFSLLEVVVAIGIFAIGITGVVALFAPVAKSVASVAEAEAAANVAELLRDYLARLQRANGGSLVPVATLLKNSTTTGPTNTLSHEVTVGDNSAGAATDPRTDARLLFASRDGTRIGTYTDTAVWGATAINDADKFFEIVLIRNETLSPNDPTADAAAIVLAYTARIRWPAFVPDGTPTNLRRALPAGYNPTGAVVFDRSQQQVLHVAGSVRR